MSLAEVKASIAEMTVEERLEIAALIAHPNKAQDPGYRAESHRRMSAMDSGQKATTKALQLLHNDLNSGEK